MAREERNAVLRNLRILFGGGSIAGLTDGQLLERFTTQRGEPAELAFAALVERHGPMVLRVIRRVLREPHDVDDAFQATFLVLVRKAGSIRQRDSVASWLYGVALRVASCARASAARRRVHERKGAAMDRTCDVDDRDDLGQVVTEEVARLPEKYRAPVVLCYLEGRTYEEASEQLAWPVGTVKSRLSRARARLQARLVRRGLTPSALALGAALSADADAAVPAALLDSTVQAAIRFAAGQSAATGALSATVLALTEGALKAMSLSKWKLSAVTLLAVAGMVSTGAAVHAQFGGMGRMGEFGQGPEGGPQDRLVEVERKLDRVLQALEGPAARGGRLSETKAAESAPRKSARYDPERKEFFNELRKTRSAYATRPDDLAASPDRMAALESKIEQLERRLDALEGWRREFSRPGIGEATRREFSRPGIGGEAAKRAFPVPNVIEEQAK